MPLLLIAAQASPDQCLFTGFCTVSAERPGVAPGVFFVALGLILFGTAGLRASRRASR